MLLTNPNVSLADGNNGGDGSFLHEDVVVERIISSSVPQVIYAQNAEFIDGFTQTLVNYSPISINVNDYWNKVPLRNVVIPLGGKNDEVYEGMDESKIIKQGGKKAFFVNSMLGLQDKLAYVYMNNFYTTASKAKTNHVLYQKMTYLFKKHQIPEENRQMMFKDINDLFKAERFVTNKEFNTKKGKVIALEYAARAAWDSQMEGALTTSAFFVDYFGNDSRGTFEGDDEYYNKKSDGTYYDVLDYSVESTILPDIWNAFVKPVAHPLGFIGDYRKICKVELTDRVLSKLKWRADGVSVKCTHTSLDSPFVPPTLLLSWGVNEEWTDFLEAAKALPNPPCPDYDPYDPDTWTGASPYDDAPTMNLYVPVREPGQIQNTEQIQRDESLSGPWDPAITAPAARATPEMFFATADGTGLWKDIKDIDEGQGNILEDVQTGYGEYEYSGYTFTKYIFENKNYLIEYACYLDDGTIQRIIEYYRYDLVDSSVMFNTIASGTWLPRNAYPGRENANIVHGVTDLEDCEYRDPSDPLFDPTLPDCVPLKTQKPYILDDEHDKITSTYTPVENTKGLDLGHFADSSTPATLPSLLDVVGVVTLSNGVNIGTEVQILNSTQKFKTVQEESTGGNIIISVPFDVPTSMVFINGILQPKGYIETPSTVELTGPVGGYQVEVVENNSKITETILDFDGADTSSLTEYTLPLESRTKNISIYGYTPSTSTGRKVYSGNIVTDFYGMIVLIKEEPQEGDIMIVVYHGVDSSETYEIIDDIDVLPKIEFENGPNKKSVEVFIDGIKILEDLGNGPDDYTFITGVDKWSAAGNYSWNPDPNVPYVEHNRNIYQIDPIITDVYTLIARFIQTRDCMVNVYNLREEVDPSIEEEFSIRRIDLQDNIVHEEMFDSSGNVVPPFDDNGDQNGPSDWDYSEIRNTLHCGDKNCSDEELEDKKNTVNRYQPANRYK